MGRVRTLDSQNFEPKKWYPVSENQGRVSTLLTPSGAAKKRVIYVFRNKRTGELLIGKTAQTVQRRISQYNSAFNHPEKDYGKALFPTRVRLSPKDFEFGILYELKAHENLEWWEKALIIAFNTSKKGYNQNVGGGGGTAQRPGLKRSTKAKVLKTPKKYYHFGVNKNGEAKLLLTPKARMANDVVYVVKKNDGEKVYVGMTNNFARRVQEHARYSRNPQTDKGQQPLPSSIRRNPRAFKAGVIAHGGDLAWVEKKLIKKAQAVGQVYNQNQGGGGSAGSRPPPPIRTLF